MMELVGNILLLVWVVICVGGMIIAPVILAGLTILNGYSSIPEYLKALRVKREKKQELEEKRRDMWSDF